MGNRALSGRERVMLVFLAVLLIGVGYYMLYFKPLQNELANIKNQSAQIDSEISVAMAKANSMSGMQAELDEIFSRPANEITEIAPYDNAKVVMSQLNGILSASEKYSLSFTDPKIEKDGTVRRTVSMDFSCKDYASAKSIIKSLSSSQWRCLISSVSIAQSENRTYVTPVVNADGEEAEEVEEIVYNGILTGPVAVKATIVFFESTNITD